MTATADEIGRRLAHLAGVLKAHEERGDELMQALSWHRNEMIAARDSLDRAVTALDNAARLHRAHHDALVASVIRALNGEVG